MSARDDAEVGSWIRLSPSELEHVLAAHERFVERKPGGQRARLAAHDLSDADLMCRELSDAELTGARIQRALLMGANLRGAVLFAADMRMANLDGADLTRADLRGSCCRGARLNKAVL